jgi:hypothetical protein
MSPEKQWDCPLCGEAAVRELYRFEPARFIRTRGAPRQLPLYLQKTITTQRQTNAETITVIFAASRRPTIIPYFEPRSG